jgi:hypothetical protein
MNDLSPAARELVESHRRDKTLTQAGRDRIKAKLMLRVATLGATSAAAGTAAGVSLASKIVLVALGVTALVGAGSVSLWALRAPSPSPSMSRPASLPSATDVVAPSPAPAATPAVAAAPASPASVDAGRREHAKKINKRPAVSTSANPTLAATPAAAPDPEPELLALRQARDDLRAGRPESAYQRLDDFDRQHGRGMLAQERSALSVIALCQWKPGPDAQTRAAEFLRASPDSPLVTRVSAACEKAGKVSR